MIFISGKWPWKNGSLQVTFLRATMDFPGSRSTTRSTSRNGIPVRQELQDLFDARSRPPGHLAGAPPWTRRSADDLVGQVDDGIEVDGAALGQVEDDVEALLLARAASMMGMSSSWTLLKSRSWSSWISRTASSDSRFWSVCFFSRSELIWQGRFLGQGQPLGVQLGLELLDLVVQPGEVGLVLLVLVLELGDDLLALGGLLEDHPGS